MPSLPAFISSFTPPAMGAARSVTKLRPPIPSPVAKPPPSPPTQTYPRMFFKAFQRRDTVSLPQHDKANAASRAANVAAARKEYEWTNDEVGDASLILGVPDGEFPQLHWMEELAVVIARVGINSALSGADDLADKTERKVLARMARFISPLLYKLAVGQFKAADAKEAYKGLLDIVCGNTPGVGAAIEDYKELFRNLKIDTVATLNQFLQDDIFGWYRVAGPNPMRLSKLPGQATDMFPDLTNDIFSGIPGFGGDTLEAAAAGDRLFYVDYKEFDGVPTGKDVHGNLKKGYVYAPRGLLVVPVNVTDRTTVLPVAIQCGQDDSYPMYTANPAHTDAVTWLAAKLTIQVADAVIHQSVLHFGRCHLLLEQFICSTYRSFPDTHPLHRLLKCHFYGTAFINNAALNTLVNPGGTVDLITAPQIEDTCQLAASSVNDPSFSFNDWMPDKEMEARGVLNADQLKYPYRDDAIALWHAINDWVRAFLSAYYKNDADVREDYELAEWCCEVTVKGNLHGFGETPDGKILTLDYLIRAVSMIIFTASVQHAAVNFPQSTLMQFVPAMPLGGYAPAPKTAKPFDSLDDMVVRMLPDLQTAERQLVTAELIGVLKYTKLGEYGKSLQFASDEVDEALVEFQEQLGIIGARIQMRNKAERRAGLPVYNHLVPKNIPQSTNI